MKKLLAALALLLFLSAPALARAQEEDTGVITGQVQNGTAESKAAPHVKVILHRFKDGQERETRQTETDESGHFRFEGLETGEGYSYGIEAQYAGLSYPGALATFEEGEKVLSLSITVYETTTSDEEIAIERAHIVVDFKAGKLRIGEIHLLSNRGHRTYVGAEKTEEGLPLTLRFHLPAGAENLNFPEEGRGRFQILEDGFADTWPLLPGDSPEPLLFSYEIGYGTGEVTLPFKAAYPTANLNFLVAAAGEEVASAQLTFKGETEAGGKNYLHFYGQNLARGETVTLSFSNLSPQTDSLKETARESAPLTEPKAGPRVALWATIGLAALALFGGALFRRRTAPLPGFEAPARAPEREEEDREELEAERQKLLQAIARLDDAFESGHLDEEDYHRERKARKELLIAIMRRLNRA